MNLSAALENIMKRTGGLYIILTVAAAQLLAFPAAILGVVVIQLSADFAPDQLRQLSVVTSTLIILGHLILLGIAWFMTPNARKRLTAIAGENEFRINSSEEWKGWKEITGLTWLYAVSAFFVAYAVDICLPGMYYFLQGFITLPQLLNTLAGGMVSLLGVTILAAIIIDRLLIPARLALLPKSFEAQISARSGVLLAGKFVVLILAITLIAILMVAPLGIHHTILALEQHENAAQILSNAQFQAAFVAVLTLALGFGFAYLVSRTISVPVRELVDTFKKIERGDLSQRARVTATDEIAELTIHFNRMVNRLEELQSTLEKQVYERTAQLKATNEVGSVASSILEPNELLNKVVNLITDRFGHYYSAIYLIDKTGMWAELNEATGEAGKVLKQNKHRLELDNKSLVSITINTQQATIADPESALHRFANPLLPYTKSEIALPLMVGDRVLGALDVQSTREAAFNPQDIDTLQGMANQVAIALENARLYQEAQQNLKEMQAIQKQYLLEAWSRIPDAESMEYSVGDDTDENAHATEVPLALRDQNLGSIQLLTDDDITSEEHSLMEAVAAQAAIALENARLVNESRQLANRERLVAEISNKIWTSTTIDGVMQTVVKELGRVLDTTKAVIELRSDEKNE